MLCSHITFMDFNLKNSYENTVMIEFDIQIYTILEKVLLLYNINILLSRRLNASFCYYHDSV